MAAAVITMVTCRTVTPLYDACTRKAVVQTRIRRNTEHHQEQNCRNNDFLHDCFSYFPIIYYQAPAEAALQATFHSDRLSGDFTFS